jgi:ricin-type beta-trefoil lectin protein
MPVAPMRIAAGFIACLLVLVAGPAFAQAYLTSMQISPQGGGRCIDVPDRKFNEGQQLQMLDCKITLSQTFTYDPANMRVSIGGLCIDAHGGQPGELVSLATCNGGASQVWKAEKKGDFTKLVGVASLCLDIRYGSKENGALVQSWTCGEAEPNQLWILRPR